MAAVDIGEQLRVLIELQAVDKQCYDLTRHRRQKPAQVESLKAAHQHEHQQVKVIEDQLKGLQVRRGTMEGDLSAKEANVKKLQLQLYQVKTNREYTALQHEIDGLKADNSVLEEEILRMMEQIDQQKAVVTKAQQALNERETTLRGTVAVVEREIGELDAAIAHLQSQRHAMLPRVDPALLTRYERILDKREGVALVPVQVEREACGGCHMNLPPQTINEIRLKERLITCESCARLLYYPEHDTS